MMEKEDTFGDGLVRSVRGRWSVRWRWKGWTVDEHRCSIVSVLIS